MPVKQITVFLENKTGRLAGVTRILKEQDINLQGFSTTEARDYGILRLVVSDVDKAVTGLRNGGYTTHLADVICIEMKDKPGELFKILDLLANEKINIDYVYVIAGTKIVLSVQDIAATEKVLLDNNVGLCS